MTEKQAVEVMEMADLAVQEKSNGDKKYDYIL